jgi:hypothetical protein
VKILFLHGWTSTPGGLKPNYLKDHGHTPAGGPRVIGEDVGGGGEGTIGAENNGKTKRTLEHTSGT